MNDVAHNDELEARFLFDPSAIRDSAEPAEDATRLVWMLLRLLRSREFDFATYAKEFRRGTKTFARDVAKLRAVGTDYDFALTRAVRGRVGLARLGEMPDPRERAAPFATDTFRALAGALGSLVASDILAYVDARETGTGPFLRIAMPQLIDDTAVAKTFGILRNAWRENARVRFSYPTNDADATIAQERTVEPHRVTYYDGRYYLVAYDPRPKTRAWRQFALDRIEGTIVRAGSFARRPVPRAYGGEDALGLFKSTAETEVTIEISPSIARSVFARRWQRGQRVAPGTNGWPAITFAVHDLGEAVRWALSFGDYARVVAPDAAVDEARRLTARLADAYAADRERDTA